jgi:hypothetical protein
MALFVFLLIMFTAFAWLICWGMVAILFYPKKSIHILGIHWEAPILQWVKTIEWQQLIPADHLPKQMDQLLPLIDTKLDDFFRNRLTQKLPMIAMFIGDKTIQQLKEVFVEELRVMYPELITSFSSNIQKEWITKLDETYLNILQRKLLEATAPLRTIALIFGLLWGSITYAIFCLF